MTKQNTSIRINGKHYDALTGALLTYEETPADRAGQSARSIDGVVGGSKRPVVMASAIATPSITQIPKVRKAAKPSVSRQPAPHAKAHHSKPSTTLMRHAVQKPTTTSVKRSTKVHSPLTIAQTHHVTHAVVSPKLSAYGINHGRHTRAQQIGLSPRVSRYAHNLALALPAQTQQVIQAIDKAIVIPQTVAPNYKPDVIRVAVTPQQATSDIFQQALLRATGHEEPAPTDVPRSRRALRSLRRRMISYTAGAFAVLAIVGLFGTHQANREYNTAAKQAGFAVVKPTYQPNGFTVSNIRSSSGYIGFQYSNQLLGRSYALTERPSYWDSQTLGSKLALSANSANMNTINKDGRTVYVYGKNQAAWVNDGILYQILGNGSLGTQEFVDIATSM